LGKDKLLGYMNAFIILVLIFTLNSFELLAQNENNAYKTPIIDFHRAYLYKNDTVYITKIYIKNSKIDSVLVSGHYLRNGRKWISYDADYSCTIAKFRKHKMPKFLKEVQDNEFLSEFDYYYYSGKVIKCYANYTYEKRWYFLNAIYFGTLKNNENKCKCVCF